MDVLATRVMQTKLCPNAKHPFFHRAISNSLLMSPRSRTSFLILCSATSAIRLDRSEHDLPFSCDRFPFLIRDGRVLRLLYTPMDPSEYGTDKWRHCTMVPCCRSFMHHHAAHLLCPLARLDSHGGVIRKDYVRTSRGRHASRSLAPVEVGEVIAVGSQGVSLVGRFSPLFISFLVSPPGIASLTSPYRPRIRQRNLKHPPCLTQ